jgi:hypothetical protein
MEMEYRLARFGADVGHDPVATEPGIRRNPPQRAEESRQQVTVGIGQIVSRRQVPPWDGQEVGRRPRIDIAKDDDGAVLEYAVGRDLVSRDPAEQAVGNVGRVASGHGARRLGEVAGSRQDHGRGGHRHRLAA